VGLLRFGQPAPRWRARIEAPVPVQYLQAQSCAGSRTPLAARRSERPAVHVREVRLPVYQYECAKGHHYEKQESFGAPAEQPCDRPRCKATATRVIMAPQVHFKGSGWYRNDSRGSSGPPIRPDAKRREPKSAEADFEAEMAERPPEVSKKGRKRT
jgi:predicted nucleic acid-binding Zn ribbon protein